MPAYCQKETRPCGNASPGFTGREEAPIAPGMDYDQKKLSRSKNRIVANTISLERAKIR